MAKQFRPWLSRQLGQEHSSAPHRFGESPGLTQAVVAGGGVEYQQHLMGDGRVEAVEHPHQPF